MLDAVAYCYNPRGYGISSGTSSSRTTSSAQRPCGHYHDLSCACRRAVHLPYLSTHHRINYRLLYRTNDGFKGTSLPPNSIFGGKRIYLLNSRRARQRRLRVYASVDVASAVDVINDLGLDTLTFLAVTVSVVPAFRMIKASPILGFFFAGVVLNQLGLIRNLTDVKVLSEWGILFLLFEMGLELSLARLKALAKFAFGLGLTQVLLSTLAFTAFELPPNGAIGTRILEFLFHSRPDLLLIREWPNVLSLLAGLIVIKTLIITAIGPRVGLTLQESIRIGLLLSQGGEFGFVVFSLANRLGVLPLELNKLLIIVVVLSMALTPLLNDVGRKVADFIGEKFEDEGKIDGSVNFDATEPVVIVGFGQKAQILANFLSTPLASGIDGDAGWPYVAFDLDPSVVKTSRKLGFPVLYGDGSRPAVLQSAGINSPKAVMVMYTGKTRTLEAVQRIRLAFPAIPIYARAQDMMHLLDLKKADKFTAWLKLLKGLGVMSDDVSFLSQLVRDSMVLQAQETLARNDEQESKVMKPLQFADYWELEERFKKLQRILPIAQAVIQDAEARQTTDKAVRIWLTQLKDAAYKAEDLLEEFMYVHNSKLSKQYNLNFTKSRNILDDLQKTAVEGLNLRLLESKIVDEQFDMRETSSFVIGSEVYGREEEKKKILEMLLMPSGESTREHATVISIVGIPGIGKALLLRWSIMMIW
ncbi:UNVERIFIED_CONTAM: K(+) efflux antiporter 3, chloroplastic [Sesamum radiatum]|uniref:K(+) efflux antiporter 3, chloroplastic n=1 Tax=Sesamum radiatum TaxID=300843 RepID=A0AAW2RY20_SESRA